MKLLILGSNGQVGWELQRSLLPLGEVIVPDEKEANLVRLDELLATIVRIKPQVIVNAAAYTAVDKAESDVDLARLVNATAPARLAEQAKAINACFIHYSTDYVFDGCKSGAYVETDATNPLSVYGRTKCEAEEAIQAIGGNYLIFRTSWVYASRGGNFAKTMLKLAKEREQLSVVADQFGAPTSAELLADVTAHAIRMLQLNPALAGLYHLVAAGETNWCDYARYVLQQAELLGQVLNVKSEAVVPLKSSDYPVAAVRPQNSRLDTSKLRQTFNIDLPSWQVQVNRMLREILG